jgi:hypothetical protein
VSRHNRICFDLEERWKPFVLFRVNWRGLVAGYDWTGSVFENDATRQLKGVIFFDLGDYQSHRFIRNPFSE